MVNSFVLGIPIFSDTIFYLMIPLARAMGARNKKAYALCVMDIIAGGMYPFPSAHEILKDELDIGKGYLNISNGHGLGTEVNEKVIRKYPFIQGPWSFFHQDSPKKTVAVTGDHSVKWVSN